MGLLMEGHMCGYKPGSFTKPHTNTVTSKHQVHQSTHNSISVPPKRNLIDYNKKQSMLHPEIQYLIENPLFIDLF